MVKVFRPFLARESANWASGPNVARKVCLSQKSLPSDAKLSLYNEQNVIAGDSRDGGRGAYAGGGSSKGEKKMELALKMSENPRIGIQTGAVPDGRRCDTCPHTDSMEEFPFLPSVWVLPPRAP